MDKILIVDDLELSREVLKFAFDGRFECTVACDGEEAIECLKKDSFVCVLLDLMMPKVDGFGVLDFMRKQFANDPAKKMPPVIVLTSSEEAEIREKCLAAGAVETLIKPFKITAVNAAMKTAGIVG